MTKVSVFGQETEKKKGKPIEFVKFMDSSGQLVVASCKPCYYHNVQLLYKSRNFDCILAWDEGKDPFIYLGHWNDGFVE